jgi:Na+/glutamate symporter
MGIGLAWAIGWVFAALLIGITSKVFPFVPLGWFFNTFDAPLPAMVLPGFICGIFFSIVLGAAARKKTFQQLSILRFALWGALGGALLTLFPFGLAALGLATINREVTPLLLSFGGPLITLGAASAAVTLMVARRAEKQIPRFAQDDRFGSPSGQAALRHGDEHGVFGIDQLHDHRTRVL